MSDIVDDDEIQRSQDDKLDKIIKLLELLVEQNRELWGVDVDLDDLEN